MTLLVLLFIIFTFIYFRLKKTYYFPQKTYFQEHEPKQMKFNALIHYKFCERTNQTETERSSYQDGTLKKKGRLSSGS